MGGLKQFATQSLTNGDTGEKGYGVDKLFVYGIFLDENNRNGYGMRNPRYATVADYITIGGDIVTAYRVPEIRASLTGLVVDMPSDRWADLDALEAGYNRIQVNTSRGKTYMYAG